MRWIRSHGWELACAFVTAPAIAIAAWNGDVARLAMGAFGPPPDVFLLRWLGVGLALTALAASRRLASGGLEAARWLVVLAAALSIAATGSFWRGRDVRTRSVRFAGPNITIAGTVYTPASGGPFPALVLVHGSAPLKRGFYALWAEHLARAGFVVLVPDKRGVGGTGGTFESENNTSRANVDLLAADVVAAVAFAAGLPDVDSSRVGLFGLSQAGWVAPLAARGSPQVRFLALITAPAVSVHEEGVWSDWLGDDERGANVARVDATRMMDTVASRGLDARSSLAKLEIPGLWLFGADDNSIPTVKSVSVLDSLVRSDGKRFTTVTFAGAGHLLLTRAGGFVPRIDPKSWDQLTIWLRRITER